MFQQQLACHHSFNGLANGRELGSLQLPSLPRHEAGMGGKQFAGPRETRQPQ
jgi:hypothetical protein